MSWLISRAAQTTFMRNLWRPDLYSIYPRLPPIILYSISSEAPLLLFFSSISIPLSCFYPMITKGEIPLKCLGSDLARLLRRGFKSPQSSCVEIIDNRSGG